MSVGILGATLVLALTLVSVAGAFTASQRVANAADAAAIAAADAASGAAPGEPCAIAAATAAINGAALEACAVDGQVVRVRLGARWSLLVLHATARAGPPGTP